MKTYFLLQYKMLNRQLNAAGMSPIIAYFLIGISFYGLTTYLFQNTLWASYIYPIFAILLIMPLSQQSRNDLLKTIFLKQDYRLVRLIENLFISLPFIAFLIYYNSYIHSAILAILSALLSQKNKQQQANFYIPTPFGKHPFEFTIGFRKTFFLFPVIYFITYQSIRVQNIYLGIFCLVMVCIMAFSYYEKTEEPFYVWIFKYNSTSFLGYKIRIALLQFSALTIPIVLALCIEMTEHILLIICSLLVCYLYITTYVLSKYAYFPNTKNTAGQILILLSFAFPPILLFIIPYLYKKSSKQLQDILPYDTH